MNAKTFICILLLPCLLIAQGGCSGRASPSKTSKEAPEKFKEILLEENKIDAVIQSLPHTLWIYVPFEKSFLKITAKDPGPQTLESKVTPQVLYLDGKFKDGGFAIYYDISPARHYQKDLGYSSTFSEEYQAKQSQVLSAIFRAYADTYQTDLKNPLIIVLVMADIAQGLESKALISLDDLVRRYSDQYFSEEFAKRMVMEQPTGNPAIIGDHKGAYLDVREVPLEEFITRQIVYRINFKYTQSSFPPSDSPRDEVLGAVSAAVGAYSFTGFSHLELNDLSTGRVEQLPPDAANAYQEPPAQGGLHRVVFP